MNTRLNSLSKVALALVGVAGLALAAEPAQAQLALNGTGSSSGRQFAGNVPVEICATAPTPLLFVSSETIPNKYEWQCTVNGVGNARIRYSATKSSDAFNNQPNAAVGTAVYLNVTTCPAGTPAMVRGRNVLRSVCPPSTPMQSLPVHWGGSDVAPSSFHQITFPSSGVGFPPPSSHLTVDPKVIVPFAIMVGADVRKMLPSTKLATLTYQEIYAIMAGNVTKWTDLGYDVVPSTPPDIFICNRTSGSGALAALDQTVRIPGGGPILYRTNQLNPTTTNMISCINSHPNSIGYLDSDSVIPAIFPIGGAYQIQIDGQPVNAGVPTGLAGLMALRCGRYIYWTDWNLVTRMAGVEAAPVNAVAGTNAAIQALGNFMATDNYLPNFNVLPDYWLSLNDTFVFKNQDSGPINWFSPSANGDPIKPTCD